MTTSTSVCTHTYVKLSTRLLLQLVRLEAGVSSLRLWVSGILWCYKGQWALTILHDE